MSRNPIFSKFAFLEGTVPWIKIVQQPTPVGLLARIGPRWGMSRLFIKREDQTDATYGGNKVRNLEFVLGEALARRRKAVVTLVPFGSNFTAALSAQGQKHGLQVYLSQFTVFRNAQIDATARFSASCGARLTTFRGKPGAAAAAANAVFRMAAGQLGTERTHWITPGASSDIGALGHANALLELVEQLARREIPEPDYIVVGAGTCGTTAGLLAGIKLSGLRTKLIAVQCADGLVCNRRRIVRIANATLARLQLTARVSDADFALQRSPENLGYAIPIREAAEVMREFEDLERIPLDTTYTSKVGLWLKQNLRRREFVGRSVLYWHTFSPAAVHAHALASSLAERAAATSPPTLEGV